MSCDCRFEIRANIPGPQGFRSTGSSPSTIRSLGIGARPRSRRCLVTSRKSSRRTSGAADSSTDSFGSSASRVGLRSSSHSAASDAAFARAAALSGHLICKAGLTRASAATGAVTLIQRFGSALNLNVHFHLLVLDGVYRREGDGHLRFVPLPAPRPAELQGLVQRIAERVGRSLERSGLITRDIENPYLAFDPAEER